jgi:hypothetical protein
MLKYICTRAALVMLLVSLVYISGTRTTPTAQATLPGGAGCPAAPGVGTVNYIVTATLPPGPNANGVCIGLIGTGGTNNTAVLGVNPAGCAAVPAIPAVGAGSNKVWADWGLNNCVVAGQTVSIAFKNAGTLPIGVQPGTAIWNLAAGTVTGDATVSAGPAVGGVSEAPDAAALPAASTNGSSTDRAGWYIGGGGAALVLIVGAGAWYVRRRQLA